MCIKVAPLMPSRPHLQNISMPWERLAVHQHFTPFTPDESMIIPLDHVGDDVRISVYLKAYVLCLHWFM